MFDFDGTFVDSMPFLEKNAVFLLQKYLNLSKDEAIKRYRDTTGLPFIQQIEIISPKNPQNHEIVEEFETMKLENMQEQKLFPNSLAILEEIKKRGYKAGISSGTYEKIITSYLKNKEIDLFDDILGWKPGFEKGKDHFNFVMEKYNLSTDEIIFIGDSLNDAKRAKNNRILFLAKTGMFDKEEFDKIIPHTKMVNSLVDLLTELPDN